METDSILSEISNNIRKYRKLNKLTQEKMAELLYVDKQYYAQLERGERNFTIEKIVNACKIFHITVDKIISINPDSRDTKELVNSISKDLDNLTFQQLIVLKKFISEILPGVE